MLFRKVLFVVGILLITPFVVKADEVQNLSTSGTSNTIVETVATSSVPIVYQEQSVTLHLDAGFVGHPVSFDLLNGDVTIAWDGKTLTGPTTLTVTRTHGGTSGDDAEAAKGVVIHFDDPAVISTSGTIRVALRADRLPTAMERVSMNRFVPSTATSSDPVQGTMKGVKLQFSTGAVSDIAIVPVFTTGVMRSGLASWYAYKRCLCAASPDVPKGTKLKVSRQDDPSRYVIVTVNDWGPDRRKHPERAIDLDKVAFKKIANPRGGIVAVTVEIVPSTLATGTAAQRNS